MTTKNIERALANCWKNAAESEEIDMGGINLLLEMDLYDFDTSEIDEVLEYLLNDEQIVFQKYLYSLASEDVKYPQEVVDAVRKYVNGTWYKCNEYHRSRKDRIKIAWDNAVKNKDIRRLNFLAANGLIPRDDNEKLLSTALDEHIFGNKIIYEIYEKNDLLDFYGIGSKRWVSNGINRINMIYETFFDDVEKLLYLRQEEFLPEPQSLEKLCTDGDMSLFGKYFDNGIIPITVIGENNRFLRRLLHHCSIDIIKTYIPKLNKKTEHFDWLTDAAANKNPEVLEFVINDDNFTYEFSEITVCFRYLCNNYKTIVDSSDKLLALLEKFGGRIKSEQTILRQVLTESASHVKHYEDCLKHMAMNGYISSVNDVDFLERLKELDESVHSRIIEIVIESGY